MLFDTQTPGTQKWIAPDYYKPKSGAEKFFMNVSGFKPTGERNDWGKALGWINPLAALAGDVGYKEVARATHSEDTLDNINATRARDWQKAVSVGGIAETVAGGATGNSELMSSGISTTTQGLGGLQAAPKPDLSNDAEIKQLPFKKGGNMKQGEDVAMIDKQSGKKVGEISYGENIFSKSDHSQMQKLASKKDYLGLGKYVTKALKRQHAEEVKEGEVGTKEMLNNSSPEMQEMKGGGTLSAQKAREILHDGTIYGKPITDRQRRYFGYIAGGGVPHKYNHGGEFTDEERKAVEKIEKKKGVALEEGGINLNLGKKGEAEAWRRNKTFGIKGDTIEEAQRKKREAENSKEAEQSEEDSYPMWNKGGNFKNYGTGRTFTDPSQVADFVNTSESGAKGFDQDAGNLLDQIGGAGQFFNLAKSITGFAGATKELPDYKKPQSWIDYVKDWRDMSRRGYSPQERAALNHDAEQGYSLDMKNIREISGGNSAFALGAGGGAVNRFVGNNMKINAGDAQRRRENMLQYGNVLGVDEGMDYRNFARKYGEAVDTKNAASGVAAEGLQSFMDKADYAKAYGKGSLYEKYLKSQIDAADKLNGLNYAGSISKMAEDTPSSGISTSAYSSNPFTNNKPLFGNRYSSDSDLSPWILNLLRSRERSVYF